MKQILVIMLSLGFTFGPQSAVAQAVNGGAWPDGATLQWLCVSKEAIQVPFKFTLPDGTSYSGVLTCGTSI